jgi:branched-chain amino acid transport system substrate-binding protein
MKAKFGALWIIVLIMSLVLSACGTPAATTTEPEAVVEEATAAPAAEEVATEEVAADEDAAADVTAEVAPAPDFAVKLAIVVPFSGAVKTFGESTYNGAMMAIEEAQAAGWDIEVVTADSKCDAQEAANAANKVIFEDGVKYIVGEVCSSASIPISEIAESSQVVQITSSSTNPSVTVNEDGSVKQYVFRACFLDPFQGEVVASLAQELGAKKAAVLYDVGNDYVKGLAEYFKSAFEAAGGEVPCLRRTQG